MHFIYNIAVRILEVLLIIPSFFNEKLGLFVNGRKQTFDLLGKKIGKKDQSIWFHCASLGEFEQGRPVLELLAKSHPEHKIILSFFSPSGYEVQKDYPVADQVVYLPLDTKTNAKKFLDLARPELVVFVKYEFWPNLLREIEARKINTVLISGIFRKDQIFFKPYGAWMRKALDAFSHFFVQNKESLQLLEGIGLHEVTQSGDTRFDRVYEILLQDNHLNFLEEFTKNKTVIVAGSTWPKDEEILYNFMTSSKKDDLAFIIAPHNIDRERIENLKQKIGAGCVLYSDSSADASTKVLIVDTVGLLTKIYSYADIAYVGGGFDREGVHNVLEPAVFGVPLLIGPVYDKYQEVVDLVQLKGCYPVTSNKDFEIEMDQLIQDLDLRMKTGLICKKFIENNTGATRTIVNYLNNKV